MNKLKLNSKILLICLFMLLFALMIGNTYSQYKSYASTTSRGNIAKFVLKDTMSSSLELDIHEINPDNPYVYPFYISNYDTVGRSDVAVNYTIKITNTFGNLPLNYTLTKKNESNNLLNEDGVYTSSLGFKEDEKHEFVLTVSLPKEAYEYQDIIDELRLDVEATQID